MFITMPNMGTVPRAMTQGPPYRVIQGDQINIEADSPREGGGEIKICGARPSNSYRPARADADLQYTEL